MLFTGRIAHVWALRVDKVDTRKGKCGLQFLWQGAVQRFAMPAASPISAFCSFHTCLTRL